MFNADMNKALSDEEVKLISERHKREFVNLAEEQIFLIIKENPSIKKFTRNEIEIIFKLVNADLEKTGYLIPSISISDSLKKSSFSRGFNLFLTDLGKFLPLTNSLHIFSNLSSCMQVTPLDDFNFKVIITQKSKFVKKKE